MRVNAFLSTAAVLVATCAAVFVDDAYHVDYHYTLLGKPQQHTTFFHQPYVGSKASLLYTFSDKQILGAVNPKDGSILWRHAFTPRSNTSEIFLRAGEEQDTVVAGIGSEVTAWSASEGRFDWGHTCQHGLVKDVEIVELGDSASSAYKDVVVLCGGQTPVVRRLDGKTGAVRWEQDDTSGDAAFQVTMSATSIYYISVHTTMLGGLKLKVSTLDVATGKKTDAHSLSSDSDLTTLDDIIFVGANTASPLLAWTDKARKTLRINIIGTKHISQFNVDHKGSADVESITLHAPHRPTSLSHFLVHYQTAESHWAEVYHLNEKTSAISKSYDLPKLAGKGAFATSSIDANVYFTRITTDEILVFSSASHGVLGRWPLKGLSTAVKREFAPVLAVSEVVVRDNTAQAVRAAVLLSSGDWILFRNGEHTWTRPESLSGITKVIWAEQSQKERLAHDLDVERHGNPVTSMVHRLSRHARDLEHVPSLLQKLPQRVLGAVFGDLVAGSSDVSVQDSFGFSKIIVVATEDDRLIALDSGSAGQILWNVPLAPAKQRQLESTLDGYVVVRNVESGKVAKYSAVTGELQTSTSTDSKNKLANPAQIGSTVSLKIEDGQLVGYPVGRFSANALWRFAAPAQHTIAAIAARPAEDPVASIGNVLGDRRVLYKYLNPNLVFIAATSGSTLTVFLLDSVSGTVLYNTAHLDVDITRHIVAAVSENWFTYTYTTKTPSIATSKGHQLVIAELYESSLPNDRGPLGTAANTSTLQVGEEVPKPYVLSQSYLTPEEISSMAVSQTKQGITSRQLLVTLEESGSIIGIPRYVLDARRIVGRDPSSAEAGEGLSRYSPVIEFDPKWYYNHQRELIGVNKITTTPANIESTSLVFAYGLDVFGTRVAPSATFDILGKDFNKLQMLATVVALFIGVIVVAPLVRRKQINAQWTM